MTGGAASTGVPTDGVVQPADGAGLLMLGLAQMVSIFSFWMALWPAAFGLPRSSSMGAWLGLAFGTSALIGFYLGFRTLFAAESA